MSDAFRYEGYAIVSADGMIADASGRMPEALQNPADLRFFSEALDRAAVLVHGRHSHEAQPNSPRRRRVVVSRRAATIAADPDAPHAVLWNPAGAPFAAACEALGIAGGTAAILGGPEVYALFLKLGYDRFRLSRSARVSLPGGLPIFGRDHPPVDEALAAAGLAPGEPRWLDREAGVSLTTWRRPEN
jgi:dihydrofolate reductase